MLGSRILVIAAHPDDEVLGCGGTIAKLTAEGKEVHVAFLADGVFSRDSATTKSELEVRQKASHAAAAILGIKSVRFGEFPDNRMDSVPLLDVVKSVEDLIAEIKPSAILTHNATDLNVDHQRTHTAVATACRPQKGFSVKTILCFEVPSSTEWVMDASQAFHPNVFVDVSSTLSKKMAALDAYKMEMRQWPHPRSIQGVQHLLGWRGATVGVEAAEAFTLGRTVL